MTKRYSNCAIHAALLAVLAAGLLTLGLFAPMVAYADMPGCTAQNLQSTAPPGMTIKDVPNLFSFSTVPATHNGVAYLAAGTPSGGSVEACFFTGSIVTNAATGKTVNFAAILPAEGQWNNKFLFQGCGGNCGVVILGSFGEVARGYSVWATDDGHVAGKTPSERILTAFDSTWATVSPGRPNADAIEDFYQRAVHTVTAAGKQFVLKFYKKNDLQRSYYIGCSNGGREGMVSLSYYPRDFDGLIVGAPTFDLSNEIYTSFIGVLAQLRTKHAAISKAQWRALDQAVANRCDRADGVRDGLIQNPGHCDFDPYLHLPRCEPGKPVAECFTPDQIDSLSAIFSAAVNENGEPVYTGFSFTDTPGDLAYWIGFAAPPSDPKGPVPWLANPQDQPTGWYWSEGTLRELVYADAPSFDPWKTTGIAFQRDKTGHLRAVIPQATTALIASKTGLGSGATPGRAADFLLQGRKLILYHGYSDGLVTPLRTVQYYRTLAGLHGGYSSLQRNAVLFMAPDMNHCTGGVGPSAFGQMRGFGDTPAIDAEHNVLTALESWVEQGRQPTYLIATKYEGEDPKKPPVRSMPLCPFPAMAAYDGKGDVNAADSWSCPAGDDRLEHVGPAGERSGVNHALTQPR
ncbi:MAG TPA: tannase/feruloyl esterase family alpha/beta hydrolase [Steroidobacteraceae bacterium]|nr:tannase/feruloyl esterase family alpha/beta hydrolase [Steroidobacteraceae bacterium]